MRATWWLLAPVLVACSGSRRAPAATPEPTDPAPLAAFVVMTERSTVLLPTDAARPVLEVEGLFVLDETDGAVVRPAEPGRVPQCATSDAPGRCELTAVRLTRTFEASLAADCACYVGRETERCADDPVAELGLDAWSRGARISWVDVLRARRDDSDVFYEAREDLDCEYHDSNPASVHGGRLYDETEWHEACDGRNLYGGGSASRALTADAIELALDPASEIACAPDGAFLSGWVGIAEEDDVLLRGGRPFVPVGEEDPDPYDRCAEFAHVDGAIPLLRGHRLVVSAVEFDTNGQGTRFTQRRVLDRASCTTADPCGDAHAFASLQSGDVDVYVANDESAALRIGPRETEVFLDGREAPTRTVPSETRLLGVRFHRDASRLFDAMTVAVASAARRPEPACPFDRTPVGTDADATCEPRCATDDDCLRRGSCASTCVEGRCAEVTQCAASHPCAPGATCQHGQCITLERAAEDRALVDTRGGAEWGNRCVLHLRAGRLDAADAACAAGLAVATRPETRAALLYNLGLVASRRGDGFLARLSFEASLWLRPNPTVSAALEAAGGRLPP